MFHIVLKSGLVKIMLLLAVCGFGQTDSLYNPFQMDRTNLPYWAKMCGTGEPRRLTAKEVIEALDSVFMSEGLVIVKDRFIERGDARYSATTFNEKYKIGYIWIGRNMGKGMARTHGAPWWGQPAKNFSKIKADLKNAVKYDYQSFTKDSSRYFSWKKGMSTRVLPTISKLKSERQKIAFFSQQQIDYTLQYELARIIKFDGDQNSIPKQWALHPPKGLKPIDRLAIIGLYWKVVLYSFTAETKKALEKEIQAIMKYKHRRKWLKRSKKLFDLLIHANLNHLKANSAYQAAFVEMLKGRWKRRDLSSCYLISDYLTLDYFELGQIDKDNEEGVLFVAPISSMDDRCAYSPNFIVLPTPKITIDSLTVQEELARMNNATPEEIERIYTRIYGKDKFLDPNYSQELYRRREKAITMELLAQLKTDLRKYIRWAKQESRLH